jgi:hypothetical protein
LATSATPSPLSEIRGKDYGKSPIQVGIDWILSKPSISSALVGPSNIRHLKENVDSLNFKLEERSINNIDEFVQKEEENLDKTARFEIREILDNPISYSLETGFKDLVYVIEESIDIGLVDEKEILTMFQDLFHFLEMDKQAQRKILEETQEKLKKIIL